MADIISQKEVNDICQLLQLQGEEINIKKVKSLLDKQISTFDLSKKVLLYKNDPGLAIKHAARHSPKIIDNNKSLAVKIATILDKNEKNNSLECAFEIIKDLDTYISDKIVSKTKKIEDENKNISHRNNHIEVKYYGLKSRYEEVISENIALKNSKYKLQQDLQKASSLKFAKPYKNESIEFRAAKEQFEALDGEKIAVVDTVKNVIVVKSPLEDNLTQIFRTGRTALVQAVVQYNYQTKMWHLSNYSVKTIQLLSRNGFILSAELSSIYQNLLKPKDKIII